jgi:hypothetical protein
MNLKNIASLGLTIIAAASSMACGAATVSVRDGHYAVSGVTTDPNGAIYAASSAATQYKTAETYDWAVRNGRAYPYQGGVGRNDFNFFGFSRMVPQQSQPVPQRPATPVPVKAAPPSAQPQSASATMTMEYLKAVNANADFARQEAKEALAAADKATKRADSSLKVLKALRPSK